MECENPEFGYWGAPNGENPWSFDPSAGAASSPNTSGEDFRSQSAELEELVDEAVPEIGVVPDQELDPIDLTTNEDVNDHSQHAESW